MERLMAQIFQLEGTVSMNGVNSGKPWSCVEFSTPDPRYAGLSHSIAIGVLLPLSTKVSVVVSTEGTQGEHEHE